LYKAVKGASGPLTRTCATLLFGFFISLLLVCGRTDKDGAGAVGYADIFTPSTFPGKGFSEDVGIKKVSA
jgi:preprotein translocase subunit SecG